MSKATDLSDLAAEPVGVVITLPGGRLIEVALRPLSEGQMWELRRSMKWPEAPVVDMTKSGEVRNYADPTYRAASDEANRLFVQRLLLACLELNIPGETEAERLGALQTTVGQTAYDQLVAGVERLNIMKVEEIAAVAASFRPVSNGRASAA